MTTLAACILIFVGYALFLLYVYWSDLEGGDDQGGWDG